MNSSLERLTKVCRICGESKYLSSFYKEPKARDGHRGICKACRKIQQRGCRERVTHPCMDCGRKVRRFERCSECRMKHQKLVQDSQAPAPPNPNVCGLPMHGGHCCVAIIWGVNQFGFTTIFCIQHGERLMPRTLPKVGVLHTQREVLEREMTSYIANAKRPAEPRAAARSSGRTGISIQKAGNFTVFGRDLQRRIHAA